MTPTRCSVPRRLNANSLKASSRSKVISGEHGIGFAKAEYLGLELSADVMALMARVKHAFDPNGILSRQLVGLQTVTRRHDPG